MPAILDSPRYRVYYATVTRKEWLAKPSLSSTERQRIQMLCLRHRLIRIDARIAQGFSDLLTKYATQGLRKVDAFVAATVWSRALPLLTRNTRHYRFIHVAGRAGLECRVGTIDHQVYHGDDCCSVHENDGGDQLI
jgi:predicted nucleic acid-binding protein